MSTYDLSRPSGAVLPLVLRKKLREEETKDESDATSSASQKNAFLAPPPISVSKSVFNAEELEERMLRASTAIINIQKQLTRGEESYYEETNAHGNLYRGWDMFIDSKDAANGSSAAPSMGGGGGSRRIPADHRWFSGSCEIVSRSSRPSPVYLARGSCSTTSNPVEQKNNAHQPDIYTSSALELDAEGPQRVGRNSNASIVKSPQEKNTVDVEITETEEKSYLVEERRKDIAEQSDSGSTESSNKSNQNEKALDAEDEPSQKKDKSEKPLDNEQKNEETAGASTPVPKIRNTPKADLSEAPSASTGIRLSTRKKQKVEIPNFSKFP